MKTLDEVIKKYEMCSSQITCSTCPYSQEICSCDPDALHYLKEYRDRKETLRNWTEKAISEQQNLSDAITFMRAYRDDKDDLTALRAYWAEQQANPALTWDELKSMVGKPIWVEIGGKGAWDIVWRTGKIYEGEDPDTWMWFYVGHKLPKTTYDSNGWQAYRKERE